MLNYCFELLVNLFQSVYFVGFLYLFFGGKYNLKKNMIFLFCFIVLHFFVLTYFTFNQPFVTMLDMAICLLLYITYSTFFLKGETAVKIIIPFLISLIYTIISYGFIYLISLFTGFSLEQLGVQSSLFRYICVVLVNLTTITVLLIMMRTRAKTYSLKRIPNVITFIVIPLLTMAIIYMTVCILIFTDYQENIMPMLIFICASMIVIAAMVWFMISQINRDNQIKTKLLLSEQRADLYEKNILNSNRQIEEIIKIKHDMKNNIACIDRLVKNGKFEEIHGICEEALEGLCSVYSPVNTKNVVLNAVLNVEMEKAQLNGINVKLKLSDDLKFFTKSTDIISIIGNLFDNAINYLSNIDIADKNIIFNIETNGNYTVIKCRNNIQVSVLKNNPNLLTSNKDKANHGKGISIIKETSRKYGGDIVCAEKDGYFIATVILGNLTFPET